MVNVQVAKTEIVDLGEDQSEVGQNDSDIAWDSLSNIGSLTRRILNHIVHYPHACSETSVCDNGGTDSRELGEQYCQCLPGANGECMFSQENMPTVHLKVKEM